MCSCNQQAVKRARIGAVPNTVFGRIISQSQKYPNNTAIICGNKQITYQSLMQKVEVLADQLLAMIGTKKVVAVCAERGIELIVGILAILRLGRAYLPLNEDDPQSRLQFILDEAQAETVLVDSFTKSKFSNCNRHLMVLDECDHDSSAEVKNLTYDINDLVYIIYTSGSTGKPKGVMVNNANLLNYLDWFSNAFVFSASDIFDFSGNCAFDFAVTSIFVPLINGGTISICDQKTKMSIKQYYQYLLCNKISFIKLTPSYLHVLLSEPKYIVKLDKLKWVILGGEQLNKNIVQQWLLFNPTHKLVNEYGPTETTVATLYHVVARENIDQHGNVIPIGKPIDNIKVYVVDENNKLCISGTSGELCIAGASVSPGYLNQAFPNQKFFINPFNDKHDVIYKTGDLVKQLDDGNFQFLGRVDQQVKINGYRIELEEVKFNLEKIPGVLKAEILIQKDKANRAHIVAYILRDKHKNIRIKAQIKKTLPIYMQPSELVYVEEFPLTANGKVDKIKLLSLDDLWRKEIHQKSISLTIQKVINIFAKVLNISVRQISLDTDFFELGGDSLTVMQIAAKINAHFSLDLTIEDVFHAASPKKLAKKINAKQTIKNIGINYREQKYYPLSIEQEMICRHQSLNEDLPIYHEPLTIDMPDKIDAKKLEKGINLLTKRYDILRCRITRVNRTLKQYFAPHKKITLNLCNLSGLSNKEKQKKFIKAATELLMQKFNLAKDNLIRFKLFKFNKRHYKLFIAAHHCVIDAVSMYNIFVPALEKFYYYDEQTKSSNAHYGHYAKWQRKQYSSKTNTENKKYWQRKLKNLSELDLKDKNIPKKITNKGKRICFSISKATACSLKNFSKKQHITIFTLLLSAYYLLLHKYTNQSDLLIGTVFSSRERIEFAETMGNLLNVMLLRVKLNQSQKFSDLVRVVSYVVLEAHKHKNISFNDILKNVRSDFNNKTNKPIRAAFILEPKVYRSKHNWTLSQLDAHSEAAKFDLTFELDVRDNGILGRVEFKKDLFSNFYIRQLIKHYKYLLNCITNNFDRLITDTPVLSAKEQQKIIYDWNYNKCNNYPLNNTISELFTNQVNKTPHNTAVVFEGLALSYAELNTKANYLANHLLSLNLAPGDKMIVYAARGIEMIIAILAIFKVGGVYVPVDPDWPLERIKYILQDTKAKAVLTNKCLVKYAKNFGIKCKIINLDEMNNYKSNSSRICKRSSSEPAYIIYTSGTTGKPKGVVIKHSSVINMVFNQIKSFKINSKSRVLGFASLCFDASISEIFTALLSGASLYILSKQQSQPTKELIRFLDKNKISVATFPPSILRLLPKAPLRFLKTLITAGEKCTKDIVKKWSKGRVLLNAYGPTEAAVCATISNKLSSNSKMNIGKPIADVLVYVLDKNLQPVPIGVARELYIGGHGVAEGYLNNQNLTNAKFITSPFVEGEKIYKTGDLVKWLRTGELEYIGRADRQIKIMGHRIEPEEIESVIMAHSDIKAGAVIFENDRLIAYYVPKIKDAAIDLRTYLLEKLPYYLLPTNYIELEQISYTVNNKVDLKKLIKLSMQKDNRANQPMRHNEKTLIKIWSKLLKINKIKQTDDFFELGGNSLLVAEMVHRINTIFSVKLKTCDVFNYPRIRDLNGLISMTNQRNLDDIRA